MFYKTEDLTAAIQLRSFAPISQATFQTSDLIQVANDEMQLKLVKDIQTIREDFFLQSKDYTLTASQDHYYVPDRAIGNVLKALTYVDPQGNESAPLNRVSVDRAYMFSSSNSVPIAFYMSSDQIVVLPKPNLTQGTLRQYFFQRPSQLVATTQCAKITSITSAAGTTSFAVDTDLTSTSPALSVGSMVDLQRLVSPFMLSSINVPITAINSTTISVATAGVVDVNSNVLPVVGDYICPAGKTNVPQVPQEFHPVLAQMGAVRLLAALGDLNKLGAAKAELAEVRRDAVDLIKNRVETAPQKVDTRGGLMGRVGTRYGLR